MTRACCSHTVLHVTHLPTTSTDTHIKAEITRVHSPAIAFSHPLFLCQQGAPTHIITTSSQYAAVCAAVVVHQHDGVSGATYATQSSLGTLTLIILIQPRSR